MVCGVCYVECKVHVPYYIYICGLSPSAVSFTLFQISVVFEYIEHNIQGVYWFLTKFSRNITDFIKNWRNIKINLFRPFIKLSTSLPNCKPSCFFSTDFPWNIQTLNFMTIRQVVSQLLQTEKQTLRTKYSHFEFLRSRLILYLPFLVSCYRHFRFKYRIGSANELHGDTFICLLTFYLRKPYDGVKAVILLRNLRLTRTYINCREGRSFSVRFSVWISRFSILDGMTH